tara:strand:+ start:1109 stop:1372 length:264 start_codon:yes stop_codon:yes gene_type:complete
LKEIIFSSEVKEFNILYVEKKIIITIIFCSIITLNNFLLNLNNPIITIIINDRSGKKGPEINNKGIAKNKLSIKELFLIDLIKNLIL